VSHKRNVEREKKAIRMNEEELLKKLRESPNGFPKAWAYLMYGAMKAVETAADMPKNTRKVKK